MTHAPCLHHWLDASAARTPDKVAIVDPGQGEIRYDALASLTDQLRDRLVAEGVRAGDRVGMYLPKSIDSVACVFGILKTGAAYIPVDPGSPAWRAAFILTDADIRVAIVDRAFVPALTEELSRLGRTLPLLVLEEVGGGRGLQAALRNGSPPAPATTVDPGLDALAYILYTSGSTGKPKGVMLSHRAATSFVNWCSEVFQPVAEDVFSSHAPFHFDLSVHDIYVPLKHGARLVLIGEDAGKDPGTLAPLIAQYRISIWYSTPSILSLLAQYGKLERFDWSSLRHVLFAGEVFAVPRLRAIKALWQGPRYWNLYGPTETNVCTYYEIPAEVPPDRTDPYPIGWCCSHLRCRVADLDGSTLSRGDKGELVVAGDGILSGYWNLPERDAQAFFDDPDGSRWYRTGDLVIEEEGGVYLFHGRRDRMVKRRGYRVELGEIEAALSGHPEVREVACVALAADDGAVTIKAWLASKSGERLSIIALKQFCVGRLPQYMIPDSFGFLTALPRTSTDKTDLQALKARG